MKIYNCLICKHLKENTDGEFFCEAFPKGIPQDKLEESNVEMRKIPCKGNIKFISNIKVDK